MAIARIALLLALFACLPAGAFARPPADGPVGQFEPSAADRDGDGLSDERDCAADDPSRPSRAGTDLDCDGSADGGGAGIDVGILPADGGPDEPEEQQAASRPSTGTASTRTAARDAAGEPVVAVAGLRLGPSIAVYAPAHPRGSEPTLIFAAKGNSGLTVTPTLVGARSSTALRKRRRSLPQGRAYVLRLRLTPSQRRSREVRFAIDVVDTQGRVHRAAYAVAISSR